MTLHEAIEGLTRVREQKYQDAARLTIELEAYQDVLNQTTRTDTYHHAWERGVYADAYSQAVDMLKLELGGA